MTNIEGGAGQVDPSSLEDPQRVRDALFFATIYVEYSRKFPGQFVAVRDGAILAIEKDPSELNRRLMEEHNLIPDHAYVGQLLTQEERDRLSREILVITPFPTGQ